MGPLAQGRGQRRDGRAAPARLDAGAGARRPRRPGAPRPLGGGGRVAARRGRRAGAPPRPGRGARPRRPPARRRPGASRTRAPRASAWTPAPGAPTATPATSRATSARDDARSLSFDSAPLGERVELLGQPVVELAVASDRPLGFVMARLCDVAPDGVSTVITRGALNLCHLDGRAEPRALAPGETVNATIPLKAVGYALAPGHRLRLALSTSYWPWLWPSPRPATITVEAGGASRLRLPARAPRPAGRRTGRVRAARDRAAARGGGPHAAPPAARDRARRRRPATMSLTMARSFSGGKRLPSGLEYHDEDPVTFSIVEGDPLSAACRVPPAHRLAAGGLGDVARRHGGDDVPTPSPSTCRARSTPSRAARRYTAPSIRRRSPATTSDRQEADGAQAPGQHRRHVHGRRADVRVLPRGCSACRCACPTSPGRAGRASAPATWSST